MSVFTWSTSDGYMTNFDINTNADETVNIFQGSDDSKGISYQTGYNGFYNTDLMLVSVDSWTDEVTQNYFDYIIAVYVYYLDENLNIRSMKSKSKNFNLDSNEFRIFITGQSVRVFVTFLDKDTGEELPGVTSCTVTV